MSDSTRIRVRLSPSHQSLTYHWSETELVVWHDLPQSKGPRTVKSHHVPHAQILRISYASERSALYVSYMREKTKNKKASLVVLNGVVEEKDRDHAEDWANQAMKTLYDDRGVTPCRRLLVFVNPFGGSGRANKLFSSVVLPVLQAAGCTLRVIHTERPGHAHDIVKDMKLEYDAIVTVSGDGLIHEVLNGLANHPQALKALRIPVAPIPAGSGNGLALNLLGLDHGLCASTAALNVARGRPMPVDLFSITQNGKRSLSFMSQSLGLMADLDLDTEHLRWMGDIRFMYGLLRGIVVNEPCPVQLSIKVAEADKDKMAEIAHARNQACNCVTVKDVEDHPSHDTLPSLKYLPDDDEGWLTIEEPIMFVYAGQGPYVSRDYMAFPVSLPDDGYIDVSAMPACPRKDLLANISGAEAGESFWFPKLLYFKAQAYRVKVLADKGNLSIDGERFPFKDFQVEVHSKLGTLLSPYGKFAAEFKPRTSSALPSPTPSESTTPSS